MSLRASRGVQRSKACQRLSPDEKTPLFATQMDSRSSSGDVPRFAIQLSRYRRMSSYNKSDSSFGNFVVKQELFKKFGVHAAPVPRALVQGVLSLFLIRPCLSVSAYPSLLIRLFLSVSLQLFLVKKLACVDGAKYSYQNNHIGWVCLLYTS